MVSTRRQSIGPPADDLVIRARDSPDVRILRDGTIHGPTVDTPDRSTKRKRTTPRVKALGNNASDADAEDSSVLETDSQETPVKAKGRGRAKKGRTLGDENAREGSQLSSQVSVTSTEQEVEKAGETITVTGQDGIDGEEDTPEETQTTPKPKRSRGKSATPKKTSVAPKQDSVEKPAPSAPAHHRFDSAEPEEKDVDTTQATPQNGADKEDEDEEDNDEDDAPEQVTTTSSTLLRGLPSSIPAPQKKKSRSKKRKHEEEADQEAEQLDDTDTTPQPQQQQESLSSPKPSVPTLLTTASTSTTEPLPASTEDSNSPISFTSAVSTQPTPSQPLNKKEIFSSSTSISFSLDDIATPPTKKSKNRHSNGNGRGEGALPMKVNSQSKNMREQLLSRHKGGNKGGPKQGFGGGGKAGFLIR